MCSRKSVFSSATVVLAVLTTFVSSAPRASSASEQLDDVTQELSARQMSSTHGLSMTKARDQMLDQSAAADLAERVANKVPDAWAGSAFDHKRFKLTIFTTRPGDTARALANLPVSRGRR